MKARRSDQSKHGAGSQTRRHRRRFTQEFKLEAVRLAAVGDRRASDVARELGIRPELLRRWTRQAEARGGDRPSEIFPGNGKLLSQDEEIRRLRRENAVLREERDILGKATAFFAKSAR
jgi:transposase